MSQSLQKAGTAPQKMSLSSVFASQPFQQAIHDALNDTAREKRFVSSVIAASVANPVIQECTPKSVLTCALIGESLNLLPSPQLGHYYFVPFEVAVKDKNGKKIPLLDEKGNPVKKNGLQVFRTEKRAEFILGYKGLIQLALRSGYYKKLNVISVKAGELIRWDPLNEDIEVKLIENDRQRETAPTIGYYAMFEYMNGFRKAIYWSREKMIEHADRYSAAFDKDAKVNERNPRYSKVSFADYEAGKVKESDKWLYSSFWYKDFDGMAYKTMLRQLISKWGMVSVDLEKAMNEDIVAEQTEDGTVNIIPPEEDYDIVQDANVPEDAVDTEYQDMEEAGAPSSPEFSGMTVDESTGEVKLGDL